MILDSLDLETALACRLVCKGWRGTVNRCKKLWAKINKINLYHAVKAGDVLLTEVLIAKRGTKDINPEDQKKKPLLIVAIGIDLPEKIATKSDIEMVSLLIPKGADVNDPKTKPILYAAHQCKAEIVQLLIINGADLEIDCLRILRAPLLTRKPGYLETLKALLKG